MSEAAEVIERVRALALGAEVAAPGRGRTAERHRFLFEVTRDDEVSVGRLLEAHLDAVAIIDEAGGQAPEPGVVYGVWASEGGEPLRYDDAAQTIDGPKRFASGVGLVDRALVTAVGEDEAPLLVDVSARGGPTLELDASGWVAPALAATRTGTVHARRHRADAVLGPPGWYLTRPGFWHGACGPASCWAGAAAGVVDAAERLVDDDPHRRAHLGAMVARRWQLAALLDAAGAEIDRDPLDVIVARRRAVALRHGVERGCADVLDHFAQATGPRPLVSDRTVSQRVADTHLYLRQFHAERDLVALAGPASP